MKIAPEGTAAPVVAGPRVVLGQRGIPPGGGRRAARGPGLGRRIPGNALWAAALALSALPGHARQMSPILPLTSAGEIQQLGSETASKALPVRLKGTVLALSGWKNSFFLHDTSGVISVDRTDAAEVHAGDEVELTGVSGAGKFAPVVVADHVGVLGRGRMPAPKRAAYLDLAGGGEENQWVETGGVVREAAISESLGRRILFLTMTVEGKTVVARVYNFPDRTFGDLVDATVRVRGVGGKILNNGRQLVGVRIFVPDLKDVWVEKAPPPDPFAIPALGLDKLSSYAPGKPLEHRVKIVATLAYQDPRLGRLYLQSGDEAAIAQSAQTTRLKPGSRVEVAGFAAPGRYPATLRNAIYRAVGEEAPPSPVSVRAAEAIQREDGFAFAPYIGRLIRMEGRLIGRLQRGKELVWLVRDGDRTFQAVIGPEVETSRLASIRDGSRLRLTGISAIETEGQMDPESVTILLRSAEDAVVLNAPWWSGERLLWLLGLLIAASLGVVAWALQVRGAVRYPAAAAAGSRKRPGRPMPGAAHIAGLLCGGIGLLALVGGWALGAASVRSLLPGAGGMRPNTALGLLAAGCALWSSGRESIRHRLLVYFCSALVALDGAAVLIASAFGIDLRIDEILFRSATPAGPFAGGMTPAMAIAFVMAAVSLPLVHRKRWVSAAQALAFGAGAICLVNLVVRLYGVENLFGLFSRAGMALYTSIAFEILCIGILLLASDSGLMATVTSRAPGGFAARRLLPAAVLVPIVLGWLRWQGQLQGLYDTAFGRALFACGGIVVFVFLIWVSADLLNRSDTERSLAEDRLRESESRYRTVVESLPQMLWTCLADGRCNYLSRQWTDYTGVPEKDQLEYGWAEQVHPEDRGRMLQLWRGAVEAGGKLDAEYRVRNSAGEYRWFRALAVPMYDSEGALNKWLGTSTDIEAFKGMESALCESEANFRQLAEAMPQIVWTAKPDGNIDYCNQRWYEFTGTPFEHLNGWRRQPAIHPEDLPDSIERWNRSLSTGAAYEAEYRFKRAEDGVYRWHLGRAVAIRNANGEIVRWFGTCTEIHDYKETEAKIKGLNEELETRVRSRTAELARANEEMKEIRAQLQSVLDAATQVSIITTGTDGVIRLFNSGAEKMLQYTAGEVAGVLTPETFHDRSEVAARSEALSLQMGRPVEGFEVFVAAVREGGSEEREWTYVRKDGSTVDVNLATTALHTSEDGLSGYLWIATDITARKALERQLRANNEDLAEQTRKAENANRAKSEFLAGMSHEIRTPINSILGMADLLWDTELGVEQRQYVEVFRRAGSNLLALINGILDLSKIEAGHFEMEHIEFDLEDVIDEAIELIGPKARAKSVSLLSRLSPQVPTSLIGDPIRTRQVLINLLGNGVKFTDSGEVVLTVANSECGAPGRIEFTISDTGIGISADKLNSIFDDFTQADSSTTRKYGGTGLGLAISRRIVERMGGCLMVSSSPGEGSTFRFTAAFEPGQDFKRRSLSNIGDFYGKRVLVVDDNATNRLILRETLSAWGFETDECGTSSAALSALSERTYAVVILDNRMPAMNGFELAEQIRKAAHDIPILMLTSDTRPGDQARRRELGLAGLAVKPITRAELLRLLCIAMKTTTTMTTQESPAPSVSQTPPAAASTPLKILIAEDSADNRFLVQAYLKGSAYGLTFVVDGESALDELAGKNRFDLILMDMQMPQMDGLAATRAIRATERQNGSTPIPIIALTANARIEDVKASQEAGCTAHLSKPISKEKLVGAIEEHGRRRPAPEEVPGPVRVVIPDDLEDLVPGYLAQRRCEVSEMMTLLADSDYDRLRILGHDMKGTGSSYGFPELTRIGGELEAAAKGADHDALALRIPRLADYLSRVQLVDV